MQTSRVPEVKLAPSHIVVVDIDDTLLFARKLSHFLWRLSLVLQRIGRRLQKPNSELISELSNYEQVVVLTGRDVKESQFTMRQLKNAGLRYTALVCCSRKELIDHWKVSVVEKYGKLGPITWIDDLFAGGIPGTIHWNSGQSITARGPSKLTRTVNRGNIKVSSELEWL